VPAGSAAVPVAAPVAWVERPVGPETSVLVIAAVLVQEQEESNEADVYTTTEVVRAMLEVMAADLPEWEADLPVGVGVAEPESEDTEVATLTPACLHTSAYAFIATWVSSPHALLIYPLILPFLQISSTLDGSSWVMIAASMHAGGVATASLATARNAKTKMDFENMSISVKGSLVLKSRGKFQGSKLVVGLTRRGRGSQKKCL